MSHKFRILDHQLAANSGCKCRIMVCEEDPRVGSFYIDRRQTSRAMLGLSYVRNTTLNSLALSKQPKRRRSIQINDEEDEPEHTSGSRPVKRRQGADAHLLAERDLVILPGVDSDLNSSRSSRSRSRSRSVMSE